MIEATCPDCRRIAEMPVVSERRSEGRATVECVDCHRIFDVEVS